MLVRIYNMHQFLRRFYNGAKAVMKFWLRFKLFFSKSLGWRGRLWTQKFFLEPKNTGDLWQKFWQLAQAHPVYDPVLCRSGPVLGSHVVGLLPDPGQLHTQASANTILYWEQSRYIRFWFKGQSWMMSRKFGHAPMLCFTISCYYNFF